MRRILTTGVSGAVSLWGALDGYLVSRLRQGGQLGDKARAVSAADSRVRLTDRTGTRICDRGGKLLSVVNGARGESVSLNCDDTRFMIHRFGGPVEIWSTSDARLVAMLQQEHGLVGGARFSTGWCVCDHHLYRSGRDWDAAIGQLVLSLNESAQLASAEFNPRHAEAPPERTVTPEGSSWTKRRTRSRSANSREPTTATSGAAAVDRAA